MAEKKTLSAKVNEMFEQYGTTRDAERKIVKRFKLKPATVHFYAWRYKRGGTVLKSPKKQKGSQGLRGWKKKVPTPKRRKAKPAQVQAPSE